MVQGILISPAPDDEPVPEAWRLGADEERARVAILGCGGAGCNTLRHIAAPPNVDRIALNDALHPAMAGPTRRLLLRPDSLRAFASMDERVVAKMESDEEKRIAAAIMDRDFVIVVGGLGGQLGGWAMSLVGRVARILGDASLAVVTLPFTAEGALRRETASAQLDLLRRKTEGVVVFANDPLLRLVPDLPLARAFAVLGSLMARVVVGLSGSLGRSDLPAVRKMIGRAKEWRFGLGAGAEKHRCFLAVDEAYRSPWFAGRPEDIRQAVVLMGLPPSGGIEEELLREVRVRSPLADIAWAVLPESVPEERAVVEILAGR